VVIKSAPATNDKEPLPQEPDTDVPASSVADRSDHLPRLVDTSEPLPPE
jgi:hypothetical protein